VASDESGRLFSIGRAGRLSVRVAQATIINLIMVA
jgi:hypothetical protein